MPLFTKGIELYLEMREKNRLRAEGIVTSLDRSRKEAQEQGRKEGLEQIRKEGREQARKEGREQARKEGREQGRREGRERARKEGVEQGRREGREEMESEIRGRLRERGLDLDELLRPNSNAADETAANAADETANPLRCFQYALALDFWPFRGR